MTYTDNIRLQDEALEQGDTTQQSTFQKVSLLQQESAQRYKRIVEILRVAFSETATEFKEGRSTLSPLVQEVTAETADAVKENSRKVSQTVSQAWKEAEDKDIAERTVHLMRRLATTTRQSVVDDLLPLVKTQMSELDSLLSERYEDRYAQAKAKIKRNLNLFHAGTIKQDDFTTAHANTAEMPVIEVESEVVR